MVLAAGGGCLLAAAISLAFVLLPSPVVGEEFRSEAGGFSLRVPKGWVINQYEPNGNGIYLGGHEPLIFGRWRRAGMWVARCAPQDCGTWDGNAPVRVPGEEPRWTGRIDGREAVRIEYAYQPPGPLTHVPAVSIRVVAYYVVAPDRIYQFGYWSYPPHLSDAVIDELAKTIHVFEPFP